MDDDEAALLAELKAISNRSAASRFQDKGETPCVENQHGTTVEAVEANEATAVSTRAAAPPVPVEPAQEPKLPPWKQQQRPKPVEQEVEVMVAAPPPLKAEPSYGIQSEIPSTFSGERGGAAEDEELLAELRAISAKSSSTDRFADTEGTESVPPSAPEPPKPKKNGSEAELPPWKRARPKQMPVDNKSAEVLVAEPPPSQKPPVSEEPQPSYGIQSEIPSTFSGERGGAAEDEELLAELRAISAKSSSADRFASSGEAPSSGDTAATATTQPASKPESSKPKQKDRDEQLPPWKRGRPKQADKKQSEVDVTIAAPPTAAVYGIQSEIPSTFSGERGGTAEDEELLAELRAISAKSSSADRFAADSGDGATESQKTAFAAKEPSKPEPKKSGDEQLPPWKRNRPKPAETAADVEATIATPAPSGGTLPSYGIKSEIPSTFSGERGGAAEDEELLAELRAISAKSSSTDRFSQADGGEASSVPANTAKSEQPAVTQAPPKAMPKNGGDDPLPPWKRTQPKQAAKMQVEETVAEPSASGPPPSYGIKSEIPSTFSGDRGGAAEDEELLAELRAISTKSASSNRFCGEASGMVAGPSEQPVSSQTAAEPAKEVGQAPSAAIPMEVTPDQEVTRDDLPEALSDKSWKVRLLAYELLATILRETAPQGEPSGGVSSDSILDGLDDLVPGLVEDTNVNALDKALQFACGYAEHCQSAGNAEQAARIVSSLVKKNALSSRPSTLKLASSLTLKLMEVGSEGEASVHSVVNVLLNEGLASRKPKVVLAASTLILEAVYDFGAATLPLASIIDSVPKILAHSNASVRETGMNIVAEICRALGSKNALQDVVDKMRKAQVTELDGMLSRQPEPTPVRRGFRSQNKDSAGLSPSDALATLEANKEELEAKRFAMRPAVNLVEKLAATDFSSRVALQKWSEKVAACKVALECGGEKPYKLVQPSSSVSYTPLIGDMRKLLSHTHFAVVSKAMEVLAMLAEGVGERLFPHLRPLLSTLLQLSKDKKLTRGVGSCLDSMYGSVLSLDHLLDPDDALPVALDERKQRNALARVAALDFLCRCVKRGDSAGVRGSLSPEKIDRVGALCVSKLDDSDASVRKSAVEVIRTLQTLEDEQIKDRVSRIVESVKTANPRAFKALTKDSAAPVKPSGSPTGRKAVSVAPKATATAPPAKPLAPRPSQPTEKASAPSSPKRPNRPQHPDMPTVDDALVEVSSMNIPLWDAPEDDGGILTGLKASKWMQRQNAIKSLTAFIESGQLDSVSSPVQSKSSALLTVVREHTRAFQESNVNIMKAILQFFVALCEYHEAQECAFMVWSMQDGVRIATQKISDRKLTGFCTLLLTQLCVVSHPHDVVLEAFNSIKTAKSPVVHEEFLKWLVSFCNDFGAASVGSHLGDTIPFLLDEIGSSNPKVKRAALTACGVFHKHIGPGFKALCLSLATKAAVKDDLSRCFNDNEFDPSIQTTEWPKRSIVGSSEGSTGGKQTSGAISLDLPKSDLLALLPEDCALRMGSKDGKTSWKLRKEALDQVDSALKQCHGLLDTSPPKMKELVELARALRDRLSDTQINLKPLAARTIGALLAVVDMQAQVKLGKLFYGPLINAAMNDIKKPMRDSSLDALRKGVSLSSLEGEGLNEEALEALVTALVGEVNESSVRAGGLADVLSLFVDLADHLPNVDEIMSSRGQSLGEKYATVLVICLTSSKSETRSAATALLEVSIEKGVVSLESIRKATERLKPALQRTVGPLIAKFAKQSSTRNSGKENVPSTTAADQATSSQQETRPAPRTQVDRSAKPDHQPESSAHPLVSKSSNQRLRPPKTMIWPEFPEEPHGSEILGNLKKYWSPVLPPKSLAVLFPRSGIKKQDDAIDGLALLSSALTADRSGDGAAFIEQLEPIQRWLSYVLCSKEVTVGLNALLSFVGDMLSFLVEKGYELTDSQALVFIPFLLEKASTAKGRFGEAFAEIVAVVRGPSLLPPKRLGAVVCSTLIERSIHAKARLLACQVCIDCVEKAGLAGIGKKGTTSTAKLISEEHLPENRAAALDLMEMVLSRMNGDIQRLARICGPSLTDGARQTLEERWQKSLRQTPSKGSPPQHHHLDARSPSESPKRQGGTDATRVQSTFLYNELPALSLRPAETVPSHKNVQPSETVERNQSDPFAFSVDIAGGGLPKADPASTAAKDEADSLGAAASLRARLMKIREKTKDPVESSAAGRVASSERSAPFSQVTRPVSSPEEEYEVGIASIESLISKATPLIEEDNELLACIETLKKFHAALSNQHNFALGLSSEQFTVLRELIAERMNMTIEHLIRLTGFAFSCGDSSINAGLSIPLLSVCLATLMALFRDPDLSTLVSQDDLTLLIRETGTALLDPRLAANSDLDEATSSQMVRAINKLAVQAATGVPRHTAFQSLLMIQQQLSLEAAADPDSAAFNSRLSRVITKLFARVIKAEEGMAEPYSSSVVDTEALICSMEDTLVARREAAGKDVDLVSRVNLNATSDMVKALVTSIIEAQGGTDVIRSLMEELGIDSNASPLGILVSALVAPKVDAVDKDEVWSDAKMEKSPVASLQSAMPSEEPVEDVATLVTALATAPAGDSRELALKALQDHLAEHGEEELHAHLGQVSANFRSFVKEQLQEKEPTPEKKAPAEPTAGSMSERLRNLRSRLQATELAVQTAVEDKTQETTTASTEAAHAPGEAATRKSSPTKIPSPAMRHESRLMKPSPSRLSQSTTPTGGSSSAMGRAAALRARLEAVKNQKK